jgi:tetratricopeptide (TPR) repeat protein
MPVRLAPPTTFQVLAFVLLAEDLSATIVYSRRGDFVMEEQDSEEGNASPTESTGEVSSPSGAEGQQQKFQLTPEQRRFLGGARSAHHQATAESKLAKSPPSPKPKAAGPDTPGLSEQRPSRRSRRWRMSTALEMQKVALLIGALMFLGAAFYIGKKYEYWKYLIASRKEAAVAAKMTREFGGASAEELIENAVVAERLGKWDEAAKRLIAAKYKNAALGGVLFHAGKLFYDHSDLNSADRLFESSIGFGENIDAANYFRGMIAAARNDFAAAERFFEAAANAAPFNADYCYSLAETLRKDHRPKDSIARYEQAARRGVVEEQQAICRFKTRMAELEAGDLTKVHSEVEQQQIHGPLSVDWLMTSAALEIQQGHIEQAVRLIEQAHDADQSRLFAFFAACVSDRFFSVACQNSPELARACTVERRKTPLAPLPESSQSEPH